MFVPQNLGQCIRWASYPKCLYLKTWVSASDGPVTLKFVPQNLGQCIRWDIYPECLYLKTRISASDWPYTLNVCTWKLGPVHQMGQLPYMFVPQNLGQCIKWAIYPKCLYLETWISASDRPYTLNVCTSKLSSVHHIGHIPRCLYLKT